LRIGKRKRLRLVQIWNNIVFELIIITILSNHLLILIIHDFLLWEVLMLARGRIHAPGCSFFISHFGFLNVVTFCRDCDETTS